MVYLIRKIVGHSLILPGNSGGGGVGVMGAVRFSNTLLQRLTGALRQAMFLAAKLPERGWL